MNLDENNISADEKENEIINEIPTGQAELIPVQEEPADLTAGVTATDAATVPDVQAEAVPTAEIIVESNVQENQPAEQQSEPPTAIETTETPAEKPAEETADKAALTPEMEQAFNEIKEMQANNKSFEVQVVSRIRGGMRVVYKELPLFLPTSHFSLKKSPSDQELNDAIGKSINVNVHDMQELGEGRRAVIVTRKNLLLDEFWNNIHVGDRVSGRVSSIPSFGVFLDLGGVEGLIHISRLSQVRVDSPASVARKGEVLEAVVVELDREKNRIALSRKELEESPWKNVESEFPLGSRHKGIIRRLTDFGAYIELKPGIDGLLRNSEISWTKRIKKPADVLKPGSEIECEVVSVNSEKEAISLSYKRTTPNPWTTLLEKYPVDSEYNGLVVQVMPQGAIIEINDELDGFMPRSKMRNVLKGKRIPYQIGERISVKVADIVAEEESLILTPAEADDTPASKDDYRGAPRQRAPKDNGPKIKISAPSITLVDMLSEAERKDLFKSMD